MSTSSLCRLSQLHEGETATVDHLNLSGPIRRRLHDLGLIEGTKVRCLYKSAWQDPVAYSIRSTVIALRNVDTSASLSAQTLAVGGDENAVFKIIFLSPSRSRCRPDHRPGRQPKRRQEQHLQRLDRYAPAHRKLARKNR